MAMSLEAVDAEITRWRDRLAAASRNVSELSELPEFALTRNAANGKGRLAEEARGLVATMQELWQGVLLIGSTLDRAEQLRKAARPWRSEEAAQQAMAMLRGASITVDLADTPVLHRRLLAGPRATATVSPDALLQTMDAAFDSARNRLARITEATARTGALRARLAEAIAGLPAPETLAQRLAATDAADPLERLEALEALAPAVEAALASVARARAGLAQAEQALVALQATAAKAETVADRCRAAIAMTLPAVNDADMRELAAWLMRIRATFAAGRTESCLLGLGNWQAQHDQLAGALRQLCDAATVALAQAEDLRARFGVLRAKQRGLGIDTPEVAAQAAAVKAALATVPLDLPAAASTLRNYEAALLTLDKRNPK